jgi:hypothetical protein
MIRDNPRDLVDLDAIEQGPSDADRTWAEALAHDPCYGGYLPHNHEDVSVGDATRG